MKKIFCILYLSLLGCTVLGQYSVTASKQNLHGVVNHTIIKEYDYPKTISCVFSDNTKSTFILSDQTLQTKEFTLNNIKVNDMMFARKATGGLYDTLIFCGKDLTTGFAMVGYFNINDVFNGSGQVFVQDSIVSAYPNIMVDELTRMAIYASEVGTHVVCIGRNKEDYPCLVDFVYHTAWGPMVWSYKSGFIPDHFETMYDIKYLHTILEDYLVTAGMDNTYGRYLNLRVYKLDNVFSSSGIQNIKHVFCIDTTFGAEWIKDDVLLEYVTDGFFSTVSYVKPDEFPQEKTDRSVFIDCVHIGIYNLSSLVAGSLTSMVKNTLLEPQTQINNKLTRYCQGRNDRYVFLQEIRDHLSVFSSVFCEFKIDLPSMDLNALTKYKTTNEIFQGLDNHNSASQYVLSGYDTENSTLLKYGMMTYNNQNVCAKILKCDMSNPNPYKSVNSKKDYIHIASPFSFEECRVEIVRAPITIECQMFNQSMEE